MVIRVQNDNIWPSDVPASKVCHISDQTINVVPPELLRNAIFALDAKHGLAFSTVSLGLQFTCLYVHYDAIGMAGKIP